MSRFESRKAHRSEPGGQPPARGPAVLGRAHGFARWAIAAVASGLITASLIMVMVVLLKRDWDLDMADARDFHVNFLRQERDEDVVSRPKRTVLEPETPAPRPQMPGVQAAKVSTPESLRLGTLLSPIAPQLSADKPLRFPVSTDGIGAPLVKVAPMYPQALADRGVEGWVTVQFDISAEGRVENPVVIAAEPESGFERSALQAVSRWRYPVLKVDGRPAVRLANTATIEFRLP